MQDLQMVEPIDPVLNQVAQEVSPSDIQSPDLQHIIERMLELAAGRWSG